ncbi:MAG: hypothetical protein WCQ95_14670, partial [Bacteroidota bacterium]
MIAKREHNAQNNGTAPRLIWPKVQIAHFAFLLTFIQKSEQYTFRQNTNGFSKFPIGFITFPLGYVPFPLGFVPFPLG